MKQRCCCCFIFSFVSLKKQSFLTIKSAVEWKIRGISGWNLYQLLKTIDCSDLLWNFEKIPFLFEEIRFLRFIREIGQETKFSNQKYEYKTASEGYTSNGKVVSKSSKNIFIHPAKKNKIKNIFSLHPNES